MICVLAGAGRSIRNAMENNMTEEQRQKAKEKAVLLALQDDMALIRRDLEIWGMKKDGSTVLLSKSVDYDHLWEDVLNILQKKVLKYC